jgi:hypothetical protein
VHHAKKGAARARGGQALRGSSEFHAWGDSNLYLRREGDELTLTIEHRAAPSQKPMKIELAGMGDALALRVVDQPAPSKPTPRSLDERITMALVGADREQRDQRGRVSADERRLVQKGQIDVADMLDHGHQPTFDGAP